MKFGWVKFVNKIATKTVNGIFELIIEDDFNPDGVHVGLYDAYDAGLKKGLAIGTCITGTIALSAYAVTKLCKRGEVNDDIPKTKSEKKSSDNS